MTKSPVQASKAPHPAPPRWQGDCVFFCFQADGTWERPSAGQQRLPGTMVVFHHHGPPSQAWPWLVQLTGAVAVSQSQLLVWSRPGMPPTYHLKRAPGKLQRWTKWRRSHFDRSCPPERPTACLCHSGVHNVLFSQPDETIPPPTTEVFPAMHERLLSAGAHEERLFRVESVYDCNYGDLPSSLKKQPPCRPICRPWTA